MSKEFLVVLLFYFLAFFTGCKTIYVPVEHTEYVTVRDSVYLKDTTVQYKVEKEYVKDYSDLLDTLHLETGLAEARAKYCIYKFFYDLCRKLEEYYSNILYGPCGVADSGSGSCIVRDLKKYEGLCIRESHHIGELLASKNNG